jgi:hypothetical protein
MLWGSFGRASPTLGSLPFDSGRLLVVACGGILATGMVLAAVVTAGWTSLAVIALGNAAALAVARTRDAAVWVRQSLAACSLLSVPQPRPLLDGAARMPPFL